MTVTSQSRLLGERAIEQGIATERDGGRHRRSVTVNLTESPLGWCSHEAWSAGANSMPESDFEVTGSGRNCRRG